MKSSMFKTATILSTLLLSFNLFAADKAQSTLPKIEENKQYVVTKAPLSMEKEVIEFFSFNCPSCYRLDVEYKLGQTIKENLPDGVVLKRYSLSNYGPLAVELSEGWAIANVLNLTEEYAEDIYHGVQISQSIKTADDIKGVFANLGVDEEKFNKMKNNFLVRAFIVQQDAAAQQLRPRSIPSFFVNGKYLINPAGLDQSSDAASIKDYSRVINYLSDLK